MTDELTTHTPTPTPTQSPTRAPALDIDWLKTAAGALAAVTAAVLLSTLGAAGTLLGAALGSVAATVGSAFYSHALARSKRTVLKAQETALLKVGVTPTAVRRAHAMVERDDEDVAAPSAPATERRGLTSLPWRRIGAVAAATFLAVMIAITAFEWAAGRSVSSYTGGSSSHQGSTLGGVTGSGSGSGTPSKHQSFTPSQHSSSSSPSDTPSTTPSTTPTTTPTTTPSDTTTPTPTPSGSPSVPTDTSTASPSASATP